MAEKPQPKKKKKLPTIRANEIEILKANTLAIIGETPGITRIDIMSAIPFPSSSIYNRVIRELKKGGEIYSEGEGRGMTYFKA